MSAQQTVGDCLRKSNGCQLLTSSAPELDPEACAGHARPKRVCSCDLGPSCGMARLAFLVCSNDDDGAENSEISYLEKDKNGKVTPRGAKGNSDVDDAFTTLKINAKKYSATRAANQFLEKGVFEFKATLERTADEHGLARYVNGKFALSFLDKEVPSSLTADDDPSNDAVLWGVAIGEEGIKKYPVLLEANFLDFKQLRQFNAGNEEPSVQALVDLLDCLTGAFKLIAIARNVCVNVCASLPQNKTRARAREPPQVRMHCIAHHHPCVSNNMFFFSQKLGSGPGQVRPPLQVVCSHRI